MVVLGLIMVLALVGYSLASAQADAAGEGGGGSAPFAPIFSGGYMDANQIAVYASSAGFSGDDLVTAIAVALAESSGNPNAYNPEIAAGTPSGKGSYGLWQIYLKAHPEFEGRNLYDPQTNAIAAYSVYRGRGGNFLPWSTFKNGAYMSHLDAAYDALNPPEQGVTA
jgi:hypothetical protein